MLQVQMPFSFFSFFFLFFFPSSTGGRSGICDSHLGLSYCGLRAKGLSLAGVRTPSCNCSESLHQMTAPVPVRRFSEDNNRHNGHRCYAVTALPLLQSQSQVVPLPPAGVGYCNTIKNGTATRTKALTHRESQNWWFNGSNLS